MTCCAPPQLLSARLPAGIIFWQWSFAPYVDEGQLEGCAHCKAIQVGPADSVFTNVIVPTAEHAAKVAEAASPLPNCKPGALAAMEVPGLNNITAKDGPCWGEVQADAIAIATAAPPTPGPVAIR